MSLAPLLFVTSLMVAPAAPGEQRPVPPPPPSSNAPHTLSFGGSIVAGSNGAAGSVNYWFGEQVGVQMTVAYYTLPNYYSTGSNGSTFQAAPSVMVMLTKPNQTRDVNFRPYLGGGINYVSSSHPNNVNVVGVTTSGTGGQAFGGVEMSFRETPGLAVTFEAAYFHLPSGFVGTGYIGGMNYLLGVHFYVK